MITLKVNVALNGKKPGDIIKLDTDKDGVILDGFWFRRLQDSARDNCVELVQEKQVKTTTKRDK